MERMEIFSTVPFTTADIDIFPLAEGIIDQEESAGKNITDQCLGPKTDGQADHTGTGKEWCDINPQF